MSSTTKPIDEAIADLDTYVTGIAADIDAERWTTVTLRLEGALGNINEILKHPLRPEWARDLSRAGLRMLRMTDRYVSDESRENHDRWIAKLTDLGSFGTPDGAD